MLTLIALLTIFNLVLNVVIGIVMLGFFTQTINLLKALNRDSIDPSFLIPMLGDKNPFMEHMKNLARPKQEKTILPPETPGGNYL